MSRFELRRRGLHTQARRVDRRLTALRATSNRLSRLRLAVFAGGVSLSVIAFLVFERAAFWPATVAWAALFAILVRQHRRVDAAIARMETWARIKRQHLARQSLDWESLPESTAETIHDHPFQLDLDITGERSLHRLLDTCATEDGSRRLAAWLLCPHPELGVVRRRQALVRELIERPVFRDRLTLYGAMSTSTSTSTSTSGRWQSGQLLAWLGDSRAARAGPGWAIGLGLLALADAILLILNLQGALPPVWALAWLVYFILFLWQASKTRDLFGAALSLEDALARLMAVFRFLERCRLTGDSGVLAVCAPFRDPGQRPSAHVARIGRALAAAGVTRNPMLWFVVNAALPWDVWVADLLDRARAELAARMPGWLDAWAELEALSALAAFGYLNPEHAFPRVDADGAGGEGVEGGVFRAAGLGHPLLPRESKVRHDFRFPALGEIAIVTGSNMSGKSTFLRALGVNLCLAYAGGPVDAAELQTRLFRLFTCIRVTDSVTDGISYFYAEVKRLKALLAAQEQAGAPLFFLIDEIFRGTNNRERLIGSRAYLRALAGGNGVGAVATHDLDLVKLADGHARGRIVNYHFTETVAEGRMVFDYVLRPGPCPTTNALRIMALEGLPVDSTAPDAE